MIPRDQALAVLERWQEHMRAAEAQMDALSAIIGASPEAPLQDAVYRLMGELTHQAAARCGFGDEWLVLWWLEHDFGAKPMVAGLKGEPLRTLRTLAELLELVRDDLKGWA